ncbi:MAG: signal peptide peptidase SppA [Vicinamibacteria bacterium]
MKRRTKWVLAAGVVAVALGAATVGGIALLLRGPSSGGAVFSSGGNYLELRLEGEIPEAPSSDFNSFFERHPTSLRTMIESLDRAANDSKVSSVLVRVSFLDAGWGRVQEVRDALLRFRKSGKPAYAFIEFCGNKEYYLATACSKVYALPTAILQVAGLSAEVTFFRKSLEKLGIEAQFEGVGKYKNAPNTFTESSFTEPHREQMTALVDSLYEQYVAAIATGRGKSAEEIRGLIDRGPYDAPGALRAGLVDALVYQDELRAKLGGASRLTPGRYVRGFRGFGFDRRPKVALVYAVGEIMSGESQSSALGGEAAGSDTISGAIRDARTDDDIKAIVLRVDSPGGFGPAADVIRREVQLAQKVKPVIVSMGDLAASGGYYVTIGSGAIIAEPGTITGSIGVFSGKFSLRGLYDKLGVTKEIVSRGANASLFTSYRPWTAEERAKVRGQNVAFYEDFVRKVAEGRGKSYAEIDAIAQGRVWTGVDALQRGLVDRLGGLQDAVATAKEKAHIAKGQDVALVVLPPKKGFLDMVWQRQEDDSVEAALPLELRSLLHWVKAMAPEGPMARLPFRLTVR